MHNWCVTGDCHGNFGKFHLMNYLSRREPMNVIILGDVGVNWFCNDEDSRYKKSLNDYENLTFYCVQGNHEARPESIPNMKLCYDEEVQGEIWMEEKYPRIRYFKQYGDYVLGDYKVLVIGGAYSVDKPCRVKNGWTWFEDEQLTQEEMKEIEQIYQDRAFDFVLSHTCPKSWQPQHLFLGLVNQEEVDDSMERWMDSFKETIQFKAWLFGHYHGDCIQADRNEIFYRSFKSLDEINEYWS